MKAVFFWALCLGPIKAIYDEGLVAEPRILGGDESVMVVQDGKTSLEFPFMVSLQFKGNHKCGGTAVNNKFIITAGHCANNTANWTARVYLRSLDAKDQELEGRNPGSPPVQTHKILRITRHPGYKQKPIENDIAIWEVEKMNGFEPSFIRFALLEHEIFNREALITGWGVTKIGTKEDEETPSKILNKLSIKILPQHKCKTLLKDLKGTTFTEETHLCASTGEDGKDGCYGDSGGPLFNKYDETTFLLFGITSYGVRCGNKDIPGVYTRISKYNDFINDVLGTKKPQPAYPADQMPIPVQALPPQNSPPPYNPPRQEQRPVRFQDSHNHFSTPQGWQPFWGGGWFF